MVRKEPAGTPLVRLLLPAVAAVACAACGSVAFSGTDLPRAAAEDTAGVTAPAVGAPPERGLSPASPTGPRYGWPLAAPHPVRHPFVPPETPYGRGHRGVDLGGARGAAVHAASAGTVVYAAELAGRGVVSIQHSDGLRTTYEPVTAAVHRSDRVVRGQFIGRLQPRSHCAPSSCLHWGARRGEEYLDPLGLLSGGRVRLLPWREPPAPGSRRDGGGRR